MMRRTGNRRRRPFGEDGASAQDEWLVTYADAVTLLMAFFIMLISFSKIDLPMFEEVQAGIKKELGGTIDNTTPIFSLQANIQTVLDEASILPPDQVNVGFDDKGVVIDFASGALFEPGSVDLGAQARAILSMIREEVDRPPYDTFLIDVEGHTDDRSVAEIGVAEVFASNWELSTAQAARVVRHFVELGLSPKWLRAVGYADTRPKLRNRDILGDPIPENRDMNRRITIRLRPSG